MILSFLSFSLKFVNIARGKKKPATSHALAREASRNGERVSTCSREGYHVIVEIKN